MRLLKLFQKTKEDETHLNLFYNVIHYCPDTKTKDTIKKKKKIKSRDRGQILILSVAWGWYLNGLTAWLVVLSCLWKTTQYFVRNRVGPDLVWICSYTLQAVFLAFAYILMEEKPNITDMIHMIDILGLTKYILPKVGFCRSRTWPEFNDIWFI